MEIPMITISQYNDIVADKEKCFLIFTKQKCSVCARLMPNMQKIADEYASHPEMHFYNMEIHDPDARSLFKSWNLVGVPQTCIINDDMIDTAGTLCASVRELKKMGAGDIYVCASHGIFSGPAIERLNDAPIVECVVTDSIPVEVGGKIKTITVANEFADAISAVYGERSVSKLIGGDFAL